MAARIVRGVLQVGGNDVGVVDRDPLGWLAASWSASQRE
jgi:hypothetical protein